VLLLLDVEDHITWLDAWNLITLTSELNLVSGRHTTVDWNMQDLPLRCDFLALANLALVLLLDCLTLTVAIRAHCLEPLDHRSHLPHHDLHTLSIAACAGLHCTFLSSFSVATRAYHTLL